MRKTIKHYTTLIMLYNAFLFNLTITIKIISVCILTAKITQNFIKISKLNCLQTNALTSCLRYFILVKFIFVLVFPTPNIKYPAGVPGGGI